jgi:hypothetical protein
MVLIIIFCFFGKNINSVAKDAQGADWFVVLSFFPSSTTAIRCEPATFLCLVISQMSMQSDGLANLFLGSVKLRVS